MTTDASLTVPAWYVEAKARGESDAALKQRIHDFFVAVSQRRSGNAEAEIDPQVIDITFDAYEYALRGK